MPTVTYMQEQLHVLDIVREYFDYVSGTSAGGIIALLLTYTCRLLLIPVRWVDI